jgi:hypothetical protein
MPSVQSKPNEANLREIPKSRFPKDGCIIVTGRTGSGKTVAIRNIMHHYRHDMDIVVVMCGSKDTCREYREHIPGAFVHYIGKFDKQAKAMLQSWYDKMEQMREDGQESRMMIIFDDLAFMKNAVNNDDTVVKILYNGRHCGILFVWAQQYILNSGPDLRGQTKLTFATYDKIPGNQHRLFDAFNPCFPDTAGGLRDFVKIFEVCTEDFGLMVLDNQQNRSKKIDDNVFFFNPTFPVPKFKMMRDSPAWKYDKIKREKDKTFVKTNAPVGGEHGLVVSKLYSKKKRKRDESESDSDDTSRKKRRSSPTTKKSKSWPDYVTIQ